MSALSHDEQRRYARHLQLAEIGEAGQEKLKNVRVLIVGLGGLGSPAVLYLAAAGIGTLGLVDADKVELSNLQRQVLYATSDIGRPKTEAAAERLMAMNPNLHIITHRENFSAENAAPLLAGADIVLDGTDNFAAHYLINDACVLTGKSLVYASVQGFDGQIGTVLPRQSACYRCLYPAPPPPEFAPSCVDAGVLGAMPGLIGTAQAMEAIKLILGIGENLAGRALRVDALTMGFRETRVARDPDCAVCGEHPKIVKLDAANYATETCMDETNIDAQTLKRELASPNKPFLLDVRNPDEWEQSRIEGATLIPLPVLPQRVGELDPDADIVIYCAHGIRGGNAAAILRSNGFVKIRNLTGGIAAFEA